MVNNRQALVIERDNLQGEAAEFKRIYLVDLSDADRDGYVEKTLLVDLMDVRNPDRLGGVGETFTFPYFTIEDVEIIDARTIAVMNDNNFPAHGRPRSRRAGRQRVPRDPARPAAEGPSSSPPPRLTASPTTRAPGYMHLIGRVRSRLFEMGLLTSQSSSWNQCSCGSSHSWSSRH